MENATQLRHRGPEGRALSVPIALAGRLLRFVTPLRQGGVALRRRPNIRRSLALLVSALIGAIVSTVGTLPAKAVGAEVRLGMPFAGTFANSLAGTDPAVHQVHYPDGQWATDLYAPKDTPVKINIISSTGALSLRVEESGRLPCDHDAGGYVRVGVFVDGSRIGQVIYQHLQNPIALGSIANGTTVGTIIRWTNGECYDVSTDAGIHTHIEVGSVNGTACYVSRPRGSSLSTNDTIGAIGGGYTSKQCPATMAPLGPQRPGGWYLGPTPPDGSVVQLLKVNVHAEDNDNGGLTRVNITLYDAFEGSWKVIASKSDFAGSVSQADLYTEYFIPPGRTVLVSFDVYSRYGYRMAPNGVRRFCHSAPCWSYASESGSGGGGCAPNPQAEASLVALSGDDGWFRSNVSVTLSGHDANGCGQSLSLEYQLDGSGWRAYGGPIAVDGDGVHHLKYRASSGGVTGAERELEIKIDTVPPVVGAPTIAAPIDMNNIIRDAADITVPWTDATSGVRWVKHKCGSDAYTQTSGATARWTLAGAGVTSCDTYARDIAGWEAAPWNSGPLIFNMLVMDATGVLDIDSATGTTVTGQARGGNFRAVYNTGTSVTSPVWLTGTGPIVISGNTNSSFSTMPAPTPVPRLSYPFPFYKDRSLVMTGPLYIDNVDTPLPPYCIYVKGDIFIYAVNLNSKACLIAEGDIVDDSTATTWISGDPTNGILMMAGRNIVVGSTGNSNLGMLFAPDGDVVYDGTTGLNSKGSTVAKNIRLDGVTQSNFSYAAGFAPTTRSLPLASPFIPLPPAVPTPPSPALEYPGDGATGVGQSPCLTWRGSAQAYELQIARAATFDATTVVTNGGSIEDVWCAENDLPAATKLYWRVRAVGIGGAASPWTATSSFTTKSSVPTLAINDVDIAEGNSGTKVAQVTITRSGPTTASSSVNVSTGDGTASAPSDYVAKASATVTFSSGQTTSVVSLTINGDTTVETNESFDVNLSSPSGATIADGTGRVTITNDDVAAAQPSLAVNDVSILEGDFGTQYAQFTVSRAGPVTGTSTVRYNTRNGSAAAGIDYVGVPLTTLTFSAGETTKTVLVTVNGDTGVEANETFMVDLSAPTGATVSDNSGTATIRNNDAALSINDIDVDEGDSGTSLATFTVRRTGATDGSSSVMYTTANGSAVAPGDYETNYGTMISFGPGETTKSVSVVVKGDVVDESDETFRVVLSSPSGATISDNSGTAEIDDDD